MTQVRTQVGCEEPRVVHRMEVIFIMQMEQCMYVTMQ